MEKGGDEKQGQNEKQNGNYEGYFGSIFSSHEVLDTVCNIFAVFP